MFHSLQLLLLHGSHTIAMFTIKINPHRIFAWSDFWVQLERKANRLLMKSTHCASLHQSLFSSSRQTLLLHGLMTLNTALHNIARNLCWAGHFQKNIKELIGPCSFSPSFTSCLGVQHAALQPITGTPPGDAHIEKHALDKGNRGCPKSVKRSPNW